MFHFNAILKLLSLAFPNYSLPASFHEAKKLICALGLGYDSIHVCLDNCILFRKEHGNKDNCPICDESRWKDNDAKKKISQKLLSHPVLRTKLNA